MFSSISSPAPSRTGYKTRGIRQVADMSRAIDQSAQSIHPALTFLILTLPLGALLPPLIILLFLLSKPTWRRRPVFWMNIIACLGGIAECVLCTYVVFCALVHPDETIPLNIMVAAIAFCIVFPVVVDSILLARLLAFYPIRDSPWKRLALVYSFPILVKTGRVITSALYLLQFLRNARSTSDPAHIIAAIWPKNSFLISQWVLQMLDNLYSSAIFLCKFAQFCRKRYSNGFVPQPTLIKRFRGFFVICLGNFIFPVCLNIVQIIFIAREVSYLEGFYVVIANNFVSILCVGFATVWAGARYWGFEGEGADHEEIKTTPAYVSKGREDSRRDAELDRMDVRPSGDPKLYGRASNMEAPFPQGPSPFPFKLERFSFTAHSHSSSQVNPSARSISVKGNVLGTPRTGPLILRSVWQVPGTPSETNPPLLRDPGFEPSEADVGKNESRYDGTTEGGCSSSGV